ncbi:hypothetical protein PHISCL_05335 [Aspergillus sclerotialis]|uniref:VLRF1 domain-containing protein n=1 Tax=Aspergillus sclerotialis TaxID=2070753 RepID=A0A3A2ZLR6_9EURO|nr:hypothetical protein PHISCL_05335 [Aspergillus sclerotialis]
MAVDNPVTDELLKRPLYVYDLPQELLATLSVKNEVQPVDIQNDAETAQSQPKELALEHTVASTTSCALCKVSYLNVQEQRDHARSDHHRYNLKAQLRGNPPLDEAQFNKAVGELDESISGSESSEGDEEDEPSDVTLTALLKRQAKISQEAEEGDTTMSKRKPGKHPLFWFSSSLFPTNTSLGIYKALFTGVEQEETKYLAGSLRKKQLSPIYPQRNNAQDTEKTSSSSSPHVFLCMIGGGHFAAMLVSLAPEIHRRQGGFEERQARVIAHKTFHRYTTRRKQGGSQSASDASRGAAHSAGSSLRRYNEAALEKEIRELLADWKKAIDDAQLLFIRATGSTNRRILFGQYDGQVLRQNDPRLRGFPFSTRRATQGELMRCFKELTRVKVSQIDEAALAAAKAKQQEPAKPSTPRPQQQKPKISKEEEAALLHTSQIQALIRRSKVPALMSYISNNSIPPSFTFLPSDTQQNFRCPTPLHLAANLNSPSVVTALLTKASADPTTINGEGKTPFELAGDRATRDAFRVARHELGETKWNWDASKVPPALSKADVESRAARERKSAEEEEANRRKIEMDRLRKEDAERAARQQESKRTGGKMLGSVEKTAADKREEEMRGMTREMRMRLERERRARAAEERIRRMQGR